MWFSLAFEIQRPATIGEAHIVGDVIVNAIGAVGCFVSHMPAIVSLSGRPISSYRFALGIDDQPGFLALASRYLGFLSQFNRRDAIDE